MPHTIDPKDDHWETKNRIIQNEFVLRLCRPATAFRRAGADGFAVGLFHGAAGGNPKLDFPGRHRD
jgi:hypothetical protein